MMRKDHVARVLRHVMKLMVVLGIVLYCSVGSTAEPLKVGVVAYLTGSAAKAGESVVRGIEMATEDLNASGGVIGRKIELIVRDDQLKVDLAMNHARDLIIREKVDVLMAGVGSAEILAVTQLAKQYKKVLFSVVATTPRLTMEFYHPYMFSVMLNGMMVARAVANLTGPKYKRFGFIGSDSEFAHQMWTYFRERVSVLNPTAQMVVQAWPKLGETDFTPYITQLIAAKAEALYNVLYGADFIAFLKQAKPYGLLERIVFLGILGIDELQALGPNGLPDGLILQQYGPFYAFNNPKMNQFVQKYYGKFKEYPGDYTGTAYMLTKVMAEGVTKAGSTDSDAIVKAVEGLTHDGIFGKISFRKEDHMSTLPVIVGKSWNGSKYPFTILTDIQAVPAEKVWASVDELHEARKGK